MVLRGRCLLSRCIPRGSVATPGEVNGKQHANERMVEWSDHTCQGDFSTIDVGVFIRTATNSAHESGTAARAQLTETQPVGDFKEKSMPLKWPLITRAPIDRKEAIERSGGFKSEGREPPTEILSRSDRRNPALNHDAHGTTRTGVSQAGWE